MSTLQFPASPNDGDSFTASNGVTYTFDATGGTGWTANNPVGIDDEYVNIDGDTMTGDLVLPNLEASGNISADGDIQSTSHNGGPLAGFRNQLINGDFSVWERNGTSATLGTSGYVTDRWYRPLGGDMSRSTDTPDGTNLTASIRLSTGGSGHLYQPIELPAAGEAGAFKQGSTWTFSFYVKTQAGTLAVASRADFTDSPSGASGISVEVYSDDASPITATTTWQKVTRTFTISSSPNAGNRCLTLRMRAPSDLAGVEVYYAGAQLEPGPVATPFEHRPYGTELALCQRYFWKPGNILIATALGSTTPNSECIVQGSFPVTMRVTPTQSFTTGLLTFKNASGVTKNNYYVYGTPTGSGGNGAYLDEYTADAEL